MLALMLGRLPRHWVLVLIEQTTLDGVQVPNAAIPLHGRAVPVAWVDFQYPWRTTRPLSHHILEQCLLTWLAEAAPRRVALLFGFDRGCARVELAGELNASRQPYVIRGRAAVVVQAAVRGRRQRLSLEGFQQAWFLMVPPESESWWPTEQLVALYRQRMQIEHCFRDWKSHLGLWGPRLEVQKADPRWRQGALQRLAQILRRLVEHGGVRLAPVFSGRPLLRALFQGSVSHLSGTAVPPRRAAALAQV